MVLKLHDIKEIKNFNDIKDMNKDYNYHFQYNISDNEIEELNKTIENNDTLSSLSSSKIPSNFYSSSSKEESEDESININCSNDKRNDLGDEEQNNDIEVNRGKYIKRSCNNSKKTKNKMMDIKKAQILIIKK